MRILLCVLLLAAALATVRLLTPVSASQLLENGGFEEGTHAWAASGGLETVCGQGIAVEGGCSALLTAQVAGSTMLRHTTVFIEPGATYTLSADVLKNDARAELVYLYVAWRDVHGNEIEHDQSELSQDRPTFQHLSTGPIQTRPDAVSAAVSVYLLSSGSGAQVYVDNVRLDGNAPPSWTPTSPPTNTASPATATPEHTAAPSATVAGVASPTPVPTPTRTPSPTPAPPVIPEGDLLNAGFEETAGDALLAWQKYGGILAQTGEKRRSGSFSAVFFSDTESTKWVYQTVLVRTDRAYVFEGHVLLDDPAVERVYLRVSWYASSDGSGSAITAADSVERLACCDAAFRHIQTEPLLPPPGTRSARFRIMLDPVSAAGARIYLDDMDLRETVPLAPPLPSSTAPAETASDGETHETLSAPTRAPARRTPVVNGFPLPSAEKSPYQVKINEVTYAPAEGGCEWFELYNAADAQVELEGWTVADNHATDALPSLTLPGRSFAVVAADETAFRRAHPGFAGALLLVADGRIGNGLADSGDRLALRDGGGRIVDSLSYGGDASVFSTPLPAVAIGHSIERSPAGADSDSANDFVDNPSPSPGAAIDAEAPSSSVAGMSVAPSLASPADLEVPLASTGSGFPWLPVVLANGLLALGAGWGAAAFLWLRARRHAN